MGKKKKVVILILVCVIAAVLLLRSIWIYAPSEGTVIYHVQETGVTIEDPLSDEEMAAVKKILWGKIRWPKWLYGYPACGFGSIYAIILDGTCYMPAWDSCGMIGVGDTTSDDGELTYINITRRQKEILDEIISSRRGKQDLTYSKERLN